MRESLSWQSVSEETPLAAGEVHVFLACLDELAGPPRVGLSPDEEARAAGFHFERDRRCFRNARGLLRNLLGRYLGLEPAALRFAYGPRGKPYLADPASRLHFNVSHSGGMALLAFAEDRELGVDLEQERSLSDADSIAERYFSLREGAQLRRLPEAERRPAFFRCWTRKEAFIKATGDGLSYPLDAFDVTLAPGDPARLLRVLGDPEAGHRWWLEDITPAAGFAAALAVQGRPARVARWRWEESMEGTHGPRREGRQEDLQGCGEPRRAVLDLAG